jgi:hypothetical protein
VLDFQEVVLIFVLEVPFLLVDQTSRFFDRPTHRLAEELLGDLK